MSNEQHFPQLKVNPAEVELGEINFDSTHSIYYSLQNTGSSDLVIDTVTTSCGCSVPELSKKVIRPLDSAFVKVNFKPVDTGAFAKSLVIRSNTAQAFTVIKFKGSSRKNQNVRE
jgi:hypothetical protein